MAQARSTPWLTGALLVAGCASSGPPSPEASAGAALARSTWRLVEFQSSSDEVGTLRPRDPDEYTMRLFVDGRVALRLSCNRGSGTWTAEPSGSDAGSFGFGPLAVTRAVCPAPSLDGRLTRDAEYVRSYVLREDRLYLNLVADGGTYVWERAP